jgi:tellurite resistance protein
MMTTKSETQQAVPAAFAAIALAAVSWDGALTMAGSRALRHALDYRPPFNGWEDGQMVALLDHLLAERRVKGAQHLMIDAAAVLTDDQRATAYAVAAEIMRSDGPFQEDERNILNNLAVVLGLDSQLVLEIQSVMNILHASLEP